MTLTKKIKTMKNLQKRESNIITPRMEDFISNTDELMVETPEEEELLLRLMRPSSNDIRHSRFGASSRGTCLRRQMLAFMGMPPARMIDPGLKQIFWDGKMRHIRWQLLGHKAGIFTDVEVGLSVPEWLSSISLDAVNDDEGWLFELKGMSAFVSTMTGDGVSHSHNLQIHTYFLFTGWDVCVYLVEDKRTQQTREIIVRRDEKVMTEVKREIGFLCESAENREIPPVQPECKKKQGDYKTCPFAANCLKHEAQGNTWVQIGEW